MAAIFLISDHLICDYVLHFVFSRDFIFPLIFCSSFCFVFYLWFLMRIISCFVCFDFGTRASHHAVKRWKMIIFVGCTMWNAKRVWRKSSSPALFWLHNAHAGWSHWWRMVEYAVSDFDLSSENLFHFFTISKDYISNRNSNTLFLFCPFDRLRL